jgi:hypothetical protein
MGTEHHSTTRDYTQNPICMTMGFVFGMMVGVMGYTEQSLLVTSTSILTAAMVFHFTFNTHLFKYKVSRVVKKGS